MINRRVANFPLVAHVEGVKPHFVDVVNINFQDCTVVVDVKGEHKEFPLDKVEISEVEE